jgi:hypothetical protein
MSDGKTMAELAREALGVQNACNLSGVVHGMYQAVCRLRTLLEAEGKGGNDELHRHPVALLWADKIASLTGTQAWAAGSGVMSAYHWAHETAGLGDGERA